MHFHSFTFHFMYSVHVFSSLMVLQRAILDKLVQELCCGQQMEAWYSVFACQLYLRDAFLLFCAILTNTNSPSTSVSILTLLFGNCPCQGWSWAINLHCELNQSVLDVLAVLGGNIQVKKPPDILFSPTRCFDCVKVWVLRLIMLPNIEVPFWG